MSGSSNLLTLDGLLQVTDASVQRTRRTLHFTEANSPATDALESLYQAVTILRNIVVDHLAGCTEQR